MLCFKNGQRIAEVSLTDRAFHYGDGCFTTARLRNGRIELHDLHLARLNNANERLYLQADLKLIAQTLGEIHQFEAAASGTVKIILSRGDGQRGYSLPDHPADVWVFYYPQAVADFKYSIADSGILEQAIGLTMPNLAGLKSLNRIEQVMLKHEADQKGWAEALVMDVQGLIVEGVSSNCFIRINDTWITPELRYNGVHGVMRAEILSRMQSHGVQCVQRNVDLDEIPALQSVFFCNALNPMKIASSLNGAALNVQACTELFKTLKLNQIR
ncbi:aminodeoxychorismate lyase [Acinetobacter pragensis]|uniref:Aminodeoxychorismate lyase n=1 Tax=Acinetobacter pragensis TaxID=1806892 RepID=A0A151Y1K7_9GAMM|nr:aminodeoxychorismate lyase [Acinetobacter pragensis]KYQ71951.1 aminodeoxychorismate lyase [Acinetobacter pragensis]